jgi:hypothetical protein
MNKSVRAILLILLGLAIAYAGFLLLTKPSNDRNWAEDQKILPYAEIDNDLITIYNIRNFTYETTDSYIPNYYDKTFDLNAIKSVDFILEPFSEFAGAAHTFLSFGFESDEYVSISVEIRKEKGEQFSALKGLFNQYEIMYVVADERDVIKLRSNYRKDNVYVYPAKTTKEKKQALFLDMIKKVNELQTNPKFYHTLTTTCTTEIVKHINTITPNKIPLSYKALLPGYSDELAFELNLIDTELPLEEARSIFLINDRAKQYADDPNFSKLIRLPN